MEGVDNVDEYVLAAVVLALVAEAVGIENLPLAALPIARLIRLIADHDQVDAALVVRP